MESYGLLLDISPKVFLLKLQRLVLLTAKRQDEGHLWKETSLHWSPLVRKIKSQTVLDTLPRRENNTCHLVNKWTNNHMLQ